MRTAIHTFNTIHGQVIVQVNIFRMDVIEAIDIHDLDLRRFPCGGYRVEGRINGIPLRQRFYTNAPGTTARDGETTEDVARDFLVAARQDDFFTGWPEQD